MSVGSFKVKIFEPKGTRILPLAKSTVTVGREPHCDLVIDHPSVQGEHVRAWLDGGRIWIQDLGTTGGTFLNGIRLPGLKPMLVRELDVLKLGESEATIGLEANLVRAPLVKSASEAEEVTAAETRPLAPKDQELDRRREELARVSRELAELKLQLQMGRLEKTATEEARKQLNGLREELRTLSEQLQSRQADYKKLQDETQHLRQTTEHELSQRREAVEQEVREMRDGAGRKLEHWKTDAVVTLSQQLGAWTESEIKPWFQRPVTQELLTHWETDINQLFRSVILSEAPPEPSALQPRPASATPPPLRPQDEHTVLVRKNSKRHRDSVKTFLVRRPKWLKDWQRPALGMAGLSLLILAVWMMVGRPGTNSRHNLNARSMASQSTENDVSAPTAIEAKAKFTPKQSKIFKKTYTENILYTENYVEAELNSSFRQRWTEDLAKAARDDWHVDDKIVTAVAKKEVQLIQDLQRLKEAILITHEQEGIAAMRARENGFQRDLQTLLHDPDLVERYQHLKRSFYTRNPQYLVKQSR